MADRSGSEPWCRILDSDSDEDAARSLQDLWGCGSRAAPCSSWFARRRWSKTPGFQAVLGVLILLNTAVIALQAAYIREEYVWEVLERVEYAFLCLYVVELTWRVADDGVGDFFMGHRSHWNIFDTACVGIGVIDCARCEIWDDRPSGAWVARFFRVLRTMRVLRMLRFVSEIDYVIVTTARAALSLAILIGLMIFVFAVYATNILWDAPDEIVAEQFGNLGGAMWSLFKVMTMDGWIATADAVVKVNPRMSSFFVLFVFCTSLALMALVPAILIEVNTRYREREKQSRENKRCRARLCKEEAVLRHVFALVASAELPSKAKNACHGEWRELSVASKSWKAELFSPSSSSRGSSLSTTVRIAEMYKAISDRDTAQLLLHDLDEEMHRDVRHVFRDVRLGLFDLLHRQIEENADPDEGMTEAEFLDRALQPRDDAEQALWRTTTAARMHLHDLDERMSRHIARTDDLQKATQTTQVEVFQIHRAVNSIQAEMSGLRSAFLQACTTSSASWAATAPDIAAVPTTCGFDAGGTGLAAAARTQPSPGPCERGRPVAVAAASDRSSLASALSGSGGAMSRARSSPPL